MSRFELEPYDKHIEVVVGWDPPLDTYFAQVLDTSMDEEDPRYTVLWIGAGGPAIHDPNVIAKAVERHAAVPKGFVAVLLADRKNRHNEHGLHKLQTTLLPRRPDGGRSLLKRLVDWACGK